MCCHLLQENYRMFLRNNRTLCKHKNQENQYRSKSRRDNRCNIQGVMIGIIIKNPTLSPRTFFLCVLSSRCFSIRHHSKPPNQIAKSLSHLDQNLAYFSKTWVACSEHKGLESYCEKYQILNRIISYLSIYEIISYIGNPGNFLFRKFNCQNLRNRKLFPIIQESSKLTKSKLKLANFFI